MIKLNCIKYYLNYRVIMQAHRIIRILIHFLNKYITYLIFKISHEVKASF